MKQQMSFFRNLFITGMSLFLFTQVVNSQDWTQIKGKTAVDVAVGKDGSVFIVDKTGDIHKYVNNAWQTVGAGGKAVRISVDEKGSPWVLNSLGNIDHLDGTLNKWVRKPGGARDIGIGANGQVWVIGMGQTPGGYEIYRWKPSINNWEKIPGGAVRIAVDPSGNAWVINNTNNIFHFIGSSFVPKPGGLKDIGVGANGDVWGTAPDDRIYKWTGNTWELKTGGAGQVSVGPDGNAWVVNAGGELYRSNNAAVTVIQIKSIFPRNQTYEYKMLQALKISPYSNTLHIGNVTPQYSGIEPLGQAFGRLGLLATEVYAQTNNLSNATAESLLSDIAYNTQVRQKVSGILALLVMNEIQKTSTDAQIIALKTWATSLYRSVKIRSAKAVLDEYDKWKADWCAYEGISDEECRVKSQGISSLFSARKPPQDLLGKNGLETLLANDADAVAVGVALGVTAATVAASFGVLTSVMTFGATAATTVSLYGAFGGLTAGTSILGGAFAGVIAAPVAAIVLCVVVGTIEGIAVVEGAKLEPMLKMKLGAAMAEPINIVNAMADSTSRDMFFIGFQEAAGKGFQITDPKINGQVRFYCQAGYVSKFSLSYNLNGNNVVENTPDLPVGHEKAFDIPYNATNIKVQGWALIGNWNEIFNQTLAVPTYICYTSYGTIFKPAYKTDCPEVGNMTTKINELTITQGGGYTAWIKLTYEQNGATVVAFEENNIPVNWRRVFTIPEDAKNIKLQSNYNTGWFSEQKSLYNKSWATPPNECIKFYGTVFEPRSNNECN
ncbi:MAG: hypothetical protein H0V30_06225 [Chitinophagaceae bacterium]|nr:hypothetical protein [Chitinophagaceae bacterium]